MSKQILLCVETNAKARTDYQYISETIRRFYVNDPKISYKPIFLESKSMYASPKKQKEIEKYTKAYPGETKVIYFIDTDDFDTNYETEKLLEEIKKYCEMHAYEMVFFCRDVEEVYLGNRINNVDKVNAVKKFKSTKMIEQAAEEKLSQNKYKVKCSNILCILDQFWVRKKEKDR